mgnify:CR=1 FL=1
MTPAWVCFSHRPEDIARDAYAGLDVGETVALGAGTWEIVGMFDSGGSAFDSELWCDANVLNQTYQRPLQQTRVQSSR